MSNEQEKKVESKLLHYTMLAMASIAAFFAAKTYERFDNLERITFENSKAINAVEIRVNNLAQSFEQHEQRDEKIFEKTQMQLGAQR